MCVCNLLCKCATYERARAVFSHDHIAPPHLVKLAFLPPGPALFDVSLLLFSVSDGLLDSFPPVHLFFVSLSLSRGFLPVFPLIRSDESPQTGVEIGQRREPGFGGGCGRETKVKRDHNFRQDESNSNLARWARATEVPISQCLRISLRVTP